MEQSRVADINSKPLGTVLHLVRRTLSTPLHQNRPLRDRDHPSTVFQSVRTLIHRQISPLLYLTLAQQPAISRRQQGEPHCLPPSGTARQLLAGLTYVSLPDPRPLKLSSRPAAWEPGLSSLRCASAWEYLFSSRRLCAYGGQGDTGDEQSTRRAGEEGTKLLSTEALGAEKILYGSFRPVSWRSCRIVRRNQKRSAMAMHQCHDNEDQELQAFTGAIYSDR